MADNSGGLRTPLGRVRFLGSARNGTGEAWLMHVTSLALVPLTPLFRVAACSTSCTWTTTACAPSSARPVPAILLLAFILSGVVHMELGMRSIIVDYVHGPARAWALVANTCFAALLALACVYATLRIGFT